jgi:hypothetical protein
MYIWQAALCILYELPKGDSKRYKWIAQEINRRGLYQSGSKESWQTLGTIMRGKPQFCAEGGGYYRLADGSDVAAIYERMSGRYPHLFTTNSHEKSIEHLTDRTLALNTPGIEPTAEEESPLPRKKRRGVAKTPIQFDVIDLVAQLIPEQVLSSFEGEKKRISINAFERKQDARRCCIQANGYKCSVCEMTFEEEFGDIGDIVNYCG